MSVERTALLQAIIANPDDDTPRLIYADHLEEHGNESDQARANFIRWEIEAESLSRDDPYRHELESETAKLFNRFGQVWNEELPDWRSWYDTSVRYRRGFVEELHTVFRRFNFDGHKLMKAAPITHLRLRDRSGIPRGYPRHTSPLPDLKKIRSLQIGPNMLVSGLLALQRWRNPELFLEGYRSLTKLQELILSGNSLLDDDLPELIELLCLSIFADSLRELDLSDNQITDAGGWRLATDRGLRNVKKLNLQGNQLSETVIDQLRSRFGAGFQF